MRPSQVPLAVRDANYDRVFRPTLWQKIARLWRLWCNR